MEYLIQFIQNHIHTNKMFYLYYWVRTMIHRMHNEYPQNTAKKQRNEPKLTAGSRAPKKMKCRMRIRGVIFLFCLFIFILNISLYCLLFIVFIHLIASEILICLKNLSFPS